jgi:hypothetical protein
MHTCEKLKEGQLGSARPRTMQSDVSSDTLPVGFLKHLASSRRGAWFALKRNISLF